MTEIRPGVWLGLGVCGHVLEITYKIAGNALGD